MAARALGVTLGVVVGRRLQGATQTQISQAGAADYAGDIKALQDAGVTAFDFGLFGADAEATVGNLRRFRDNVVAKVR